MTKRKIISWTPEKRKETINSLLNIGMRGEEAIRLAFLTEKKDSGKLKNQEFHEFIKLSEKRCHMQLSKLAMQDYSQKLAEKWTCKNM